MCQAAAQVLEAAVIAVPHPKWDERPLLVVVPHPAGAPPSPEDVLAFMQVCSQCSLADAEPFCAPPRDADRRAAHLLSI